MTTSLVTSSYGRPIEAGKQHIVLQDTPTGAGSREVTFTLDCDSVLMSLYVTAITGSFSCIVYTETSPGMDLVIITFPTVNAPTSDLLLRKAASAMNNIRVAVTYSGSCEFEIRAKGISAGESSVKILGPTDWSVDQTDITTVPAQVIPTSLTDRNGLVIKNFSTVGILYLAESSAKLTAGKGYPIGPGESLGFDLAGGQEIWGQASAGTIDVRYAEAGGS